MTESNLTGEQIISNGGFTQEAVFGPVPSRRLGISLGVNNIFRKSCTYSCAYCQIGKAPHTFSKRREFYNPDDIIKKIHEKVDATEHAGGHIDYITFVPDGEPTLDINLGRLIMGAKSTGIPVAVISNASLINDLKVQHELFEADLVSFKVDTVTRNIWQVINSPDLCIDFVEMHRGLVAFSREYMGTLLTETMLISRINDYPQELSEIATYISKLSPETAYISTPTRPPASSWVNLPPARSVVEAADIFKKCGLNVSLLNTPESGEFMVTGDIEEGLRGIMSVHPMREDDLMNLVEASGHKIGLITRMVKSGDLIVREYADTRFYVA